MGQGKLRRSRRQFIPERWIGSSVRAVNPPGIPGGGLSMIEGADRPLTLRDALRAAPLELLGHDLLDAHGPEFRVLVKILDPGQAIPFHMHATDAQVARSPRRYPGERFGKDEAYYFLDAPRGPNPYTHVGLFPQVTRQHLVEASRKGAEHLLELSPPIYQRFGQGFFLPAGVPHRPGTALTLEVQQPSDVYSLFTSVADFAMIDYPLSYQVGRVKPFQLVPAPIGQKQRGGEVCTIFPIETCRTFQGRRIRVTGSLLYSESLPFVMLVWRGHGTMNGRRIRPGDEFFIAHDTAAHGVELFPRGDVPLELFTFLPAIQE
jgi:mannose-6-phosphate isomerase class I